MADEPPAELLQGRRALEHLGFCAMLDDWTWFPSVGKWALPCRVAVTPNGLVPKITLWYLAAENDYPWGTVEAFPAKDGGLTQTFHHQAYNGPGNADVPWRDGKVCVQTSLGHFGRRLYDIEPWAADERLAWHVSRLHEWLVAASTGNLVEPGDPFELPEFPQMSASIDIAFCEDDESFVRWQRIDETSGAVDFARLENNDAVFLATCFRDRGSVVLRKILYGDVPLAKTTTTGVWIKMPVVPCLPPWQAPATVGELREILRTVDIDFDHIISRMGRELRDGRPHPVLVGFPIPLQVGGSDARYHWQGLISPILSHGTPKGFRPTERSYAARDKAQVITDDTRLKWVTSKNWAPSELGSRGRLSSEVLSKRILIVGVGALGSMVAELLGRAGCTDVLLMDGQRLEVGNLVRHTLDLGDVCKQKATSVAERLKTVHPHTHVRALCTSFPPRDDADKAAVRECDWVLDCTAEDTVLQRMSQFTWGGDKLFVTASVGLFAKRMFLYFARGSHFPHMAFREAIQPLIESELEEHKGTRLPRDGIGCWHPVFPARADHIWAMAALVVMQLEEVSTGRDQLRTLRVFERTFEGSVFTGIHRTL